MRPHAPTRGRERTVQFDDESGEPAAEVLSSAEGHAAGGLSILPEGDDAPGATSWSAPYRRRGGRGRAGLAVGAGAFAVTSALSGGGAQPESVVPATAVFYAEVDLDPSAGQKMEAFTFLRKFPELQDTFRADGTFGFERLFKDTDVDYAADIQPWLGDRYAVAVVPGADKGDAPRFEVVLQTTDEAAAQSSLTRLIEESGSAEVVSVAVRDGYAILAGSASFTFGDSSAADIAGQLSAEAQTASLEASDTYQSDIAPFGSGIATVWADNERLASLVEDLTESSGLPTAGSNLLGDAKGSSVAVLKFDDGALELAGAGSVEVALGSGTVPAVQTLPDSAYVAVGGANLGSALQQVFDSYLGQLEGAGVSPESLLGVDWESAFGPAGDTDEWPVLFGDQTVLAMGGEGDEPSVGVHVVGGQDTVDAVRGLLADLDAPVVVDETPDGVVVASDESWLEALSAGGTLGDSPAFRAAVPDADKAGMVVYVDVNALVEAGGDEFSAEDLKVAGPLAAIGFTVTSQDGQGTFRLRVTTD